MASLTSVAEPLLPAVPGYQLVDEIGRGGMGVVYRARDLRLNREVAIKSLNPKYAADSAVATRFQAEAQLTGQLQHPGIPAVHELGTLPDNRPFLAMKLVKGRTLQELLKERDDLPSPSGRGAGGEGAERGRFIAIFEQICHAVGYVHAHHVIHRDLKPSNVMVGAFGEVQVMDWGLAKVIDPNRKTERPAEEEDDPEATAAFVTAIDTPERGGSATRTGSVLGTPAYMAPEQAAGQIRRLDARSDVFGLGAILCQILTGHPPYEGTDDNERRVKAVRGELGEAFARLEACGAEPELVALCKRCLAFRQEDRPRDGNAVAAEVAAIRQAAEERARRAELERTRAEVAAAEQAKRRRLVQWAGGLIAAVLLLGLGISLWQMNRAITAEAAAREERDAKAKALEAETIARQRAMTALRTLTDDIVENQMARAETLTEENKAFLKKIIEHFEGFAAITANDAESRAIRAEGHARVGLMRYRLGDLKEAEAAYTAALDIHKQLADEFPTRPEFRQALARSHNNLGVLLADTGRLKEAEAAYTAARDIQKQLADEFPTRPDFRQELAQSHNNLGVLLRATGRLKEAEAAYRDALDLRKQLAAEFPTRPDFRQELAQSHNNLGVLLDATGRLKEAEAAYTAALDIRKQLAAEFPTNLDLRNELAGTCVNLALLCNQRREFKAAKQHLAEGEPHHQAALEANSRNPTYRQFYRNHLWALTEAHAGLGEQADALKAAQRVRDLGWDPPKNAYDAACGLALCIPIVAKDEQLDADKRKAAVQFYGDQAMKLLREAVEKGFKNVEHMKKDTDLDPLREREDFQKLLAELPQPAARLLDMVHDVGAGLKLSGQLNRNTGTLIYQVRLEKDVEYVIDLTSPDPKALDPYLLVSDDKNKQLAEDADSGGNQNARLVFRAPADGVYRLHATSYNQGQGDFTLTVRRKE